MTDDDVRALFSKINQSDLPYRVFETPAVAEPAEPEAPPAAAPAEPTPEAAAFLDAYDQTPGASPATDAPIRLKDLFATLAARGRGGGR